MPDKRGRDGILATAAIDYITATSQIISSENPLLRLGDILVDVARRDGNRRTEWRSHGYVGVACGDVGVAARDDGAILRVSGGRAASVGREIIRLASNVSRLDLQCTVRFNRDRAALDRQHEREFRRYKRDGGLTRTARSIDGLGAGNTLVIGSRSSNYYGRIYDKWRESGDDAYRHCWRYEVECKGDGANAAAKMVAESSAVEEDISRGVRGWFVGRGIDPRFATDTNHRFDSVPRARSDAEDLLRYIYKQVTPLVRRLEEWYSVEDLDDVLHGRLSPDRVKMLGKETEEGRSAYEAWTIDSERQRRTVRRHSKGR